MSRKVPKYTVISDNSEKKGWHFPPSSVCLGTEVVSLPTADYTLKGYENIFVVERKGRVSEVSSNFTDPAFVRELERMNSFDFPHVICEFTLAELAAFPYGSDIPKSKWPELRVNGRFLVKTYWEFCLSFKAKWTFAGKTKGREAAMSLFKRVVERDVA